MPRTWRPSIPCPGNGRAEVNPGSLEYRRSRERKQREKADRDAVNTGRVIQKRNKAIKEGGGVTTKAECTDPVDENPTLIGENS